MHAARRYDARVGGTPGRLRTWRSAQETRFSASRNSLQQKNHSQTVSAHRPKVSRRIIAPGVHFRPVDRAGDRELLEIVALLKVMARANARRHRGKAAALQHLPRAAASMARCTSSNCTRPPGPVPVIPAKIDAAFGSKFAGDGSASDTFLRGAAKSRPSRAPAATDLGSGVLGAAAIATGALASRQTRSRRPDPRTGRQAVDLHQESASAAR